MAKTSTVFHLSGELARRKLRILACDLDPQSSLTQGFLGPTEAAAIPTSETVASLFRPGFAPIAESLIRPSGVPGVDLLPGSFGSVRHNTPAREEWGDSQWGLAEFLGEVRAEYDLILIDCPPNLHLCSWAAMLASTRLIIPVQPEDFGSQGLAPVHESIREASAANPGLGLAGYLLTLVDRRLTVHAAYEAMLREGYGETVLETTIPRSTAFIEAVAMRSPVCRYKPRSAASRAVASFADELTGRLETTNESGYIEVAA